MRLLSSHEYGVLDVLSRLSATRDGGMSRSGDVRRRFLRSRGTNRNVTESVHFLACYVLLRFACVISIRRVISALREGRSRDECVWQFGMSLVISGRRSAADSAQAVIRGVTASIHVVR